MSPHEFAIKASDTFGIKHGGGDRAGSANGNKAMFCGIPPAINALKLHLMYYADTKVEIKELPPYVDGFPVLHVTFPNFLDIPAVAKTL